MARKKPKKKQEAQLDWFRLQGEDLKTALTMFQTVIPNQDAMAKRLRSSYITIKLIVDHYGPYTNINVGKESMTAQRGIERIKLSALQKGVRLE